MPWTGTPSSAGKSYFVRLRVVHKAGRPEEPASFSLLYTPSDAPVRNATYLGCYKDLTDGKRDLPFNAGDEPKDDSRAVCGAKCDAFVYFGLQDGDNCFCGNEPPAQGKAPETDCNMPCPGERGVMCGASCRNSVYKLHGPPRTQPVPAEAFGGDLQPAQVQRLSMSRGLTHGRWNTWAKASVTAQILIPTGLMLKFGLCQVDGGTCKEDGEKGDIDSGVVRLGPHALDHSYTQPYFSYNQANVSVETSQVGGVAGGDLLVTVTPQGTWNRSNYAVVVIGLFTDQGVDQASWNLPGTVAAQPTGAGSMVATPAGSGLGTEVVRGATDSQLSSAHFTVNQPQYLTYAFPAAANGTVAVMTGSTSRTTDDAVTLIAAARDAEMLTYAKYGDLAEAAEASQAGMMWNVQFSPDIPGTFAPVSRGWGRPWVIFDWDNIFGAYQLSLGSKSLAYSQLAAVIKTKTAEGMVPNFWQPQSISYDRTEPVIGAKVLAEMFHRHGDRWIVELLYPDCFDWLAWFFRKRLEEPLGLICLGSDPGLPTSDSPNMQAARYESGLDNSPMYDGEFFNSTTNHMMLYVCCAPDEVPSAANMGFVTLCCLLPGFRRICRWSRELHC